MNPFTLPGPQFLFFFIVLSLAVLVFCIVRMRMGGSSRTLPLAPLTGDPYAIAFMRGGREELVRLAIFNLHDRGILEDSVDGKLRLARPNAWEFLRRPIDRAIVGLCEMGCSFDTIKLAPQLDASCEQYDRDLAKAGFMLDKPERDSRGSFVTWACGLLLAVAGIKVAYALLAGRSNVGALIVLTIVALVLVIVVYEHRLTASGKRALGNLETLMKRLKTSAARLRAGGESNEALLLAAVFGLHALPADAFPFVETIQPRPRSSSSSDAAGDGGGDSGCGGGGGCGGCGGD